MSLDRDRLAKLLGMLGSDHEGEVLNAARAADKLRRDSNATWPEIINPAPAYQPSPSPVAETPDFASITEAIEYVQLYRHRLTPWERGFIHSVEQRRRPLTDKQLKVLSRLVRRAGGGW